jgi:DNA-binding PadR family transcriptional regulator
MWPLVPFRCGYGVGVATAPKRITRTFLDVAGVLLGADGEPLHGWAIIKETGLDGATVYKILQRMVRTGWATAALEDPGPVRARRRYYVLTGDGAELAERLLAGRPSPGRATGVAGGPATAVS